MSPLAELSANDLTIASDWDSMCDIVPEEPLLGSYEVEVSKVLEEWTSDEESDHDLDIMEVDEQIGLNFLTDDIFGYECESSSSPHDDLLSMNLDVPEDRFMTPPLTPEHSSESVPPLLDCQYQDAFKKLAESMKRSQETRASLTMKIPVANVSFDRRTSIRSVLNSIENSSKQINSYFGSISSM